MKPLFKKHVLVSIIFYLGTLSAPLFAQVPKLKPSDPMPLNLFSELAKAVNPAVVNIFTTYLPKSPYQRYGQEGIRDPFFEMFEQFLQQNPYGGRQRPAQALGSGFIIREDGLIITNNHVIDKADVIKVQIEEKSKESFEAKVIGTDAATDIALIKIESKRKFPVLKLGSSSDLEVGQWVAAFGNPFGHGHSMTKGIISAIGRELDEINLAPFIQTDASINPGNSGGPLVDTQGSVIGVNTAIDGRAQGIGFAIPIDIVKTIIAQLEKSGTVERGYLGLGLNDIDEEGADTLNMDQTKGALVIEVWPGSPAEKAGFRPYDLVVNFDNLKISSSSELIKAVKSTPVGKKVVVNVIRDSKPRTLTVIIASAKGADLEPGTQLQGRKAPGNKSEFLAAPHNLGFFIANYSPAIAKEFGLPRAQQNHPVVVEVVRGSEAAKAGLAPGDLILDVNRTRTEKAQDVVRNLRRGTLNVLRVLKRDRVVLIPLKSR